MYKDSITEMRTEMQKKGLDIDYDLYNDIMTNDKTHQKIYEDAKKDIREHLISFLNLPIDYTNIIEPSVPVQNITNNHMTANRIMYAYEVANKYYTLSKSSDNFKHFFEWKKQLADISGLGINSDKFYKLLLFLKQACNVAFSGKTTYSTDIILYTLNKNLQDDQIPKTPLFFQITDKDKSLSMYVPNSSNLSPEDEAITDNRRRYLQEDVSKQNKTKHQGISLNLNNSERVNYEDPPAVDTTFDTSKAIVMSLVLLILVTIFVCIIILIMWSLWPFVATLLNMFTRGSIYAVLFISDLFRGRYAPSQLNVKMARMETAFLMKQNI